ncbi:MAG: zf-TFIIB domain-containing protein [bacterium]|nr:zf-TFIIB domain-containing protein [bacterium]
MPIKPSDGEEEFFKAQELHKMRQSQVDSAATMEVQEKDRLKKLHWMRCPKCGLELQEVEFRGVQVDTCFSCEGMFLDGGEIEKILAHEEPGMLERIAQSLFKPISGS